jgi:hypothetical protein
MKNARVHNISQDQGLGDSAQALARVSLSTDLTGTRLFPKMLYVLPDQSCRLGKVTSCQKFEYDRPYH